MAKTTKIEPVTITAQLGTPEQRVYPDGHIVVDLPDGSWYSISPKAYELAKKHAQELADSIKTYEGMISNCKAAIKDLPKKIADLQKELDLVDLPDAPDEDLSKISALKSQKAQHEFMLSEANRLKPFYEKALSDLRDHIDLHEIQLPE